MCIRDRLTLVLAPSITAASWYRCAYDGVSRSACCCPTKPDPQSNKAPAPNTSMRAACCCTVTHVASRAPEAAAKAAAPIQVSPSVVAAPAIVTRPRVALAAVALDRPRAHGDPPDTLFARRCSLLL